MSSSTAHNRCVCGSATSLPHPNPRLSAWTSHTPRTLGDILPEDNLESFVNKRKKAITDTIKEKSQFIL